MTPYEKKTFGVSLGISTAFHIAFLLISVFFPKKIYGLRYGEYVAVGVWEYDTGIEGLPAGTKKEKTLEKEKKKVKVLTAREGERKVPASETGEEQEKPYNPADYPGDREAGLAKISPLISPKSIQNLKLFGEVRLEVVVSPEGKARSVRVVQSSGIPLIDDAAMKMAMRLEYVGKVYKGQKVESQVLLRCSLSPEFSVCAF
ncbi:MAG: energy transducer TonB [bacterium JZ-2024 1]